MKLVDVLFILICALVIAIWIFFKNRRNRKKEEIYSKCRYCSYSGLCSKRKKKK